MKRMSPTDVGRLAKLTIESRRRSLGDWSVEKAVNGGIWRAAPDKHNEYISPFGLL